MSTMNVSLPDELKTFVDTRVSSGHCGTSSEYVRDLIRKDQARQHLRERLAEGLASPSVGEANARFWSAKRKAVRAVLKQRRA